MSDIHLLPFTFWLSLAILIGAAVFGWRRRDCGWGYPLIAVCGTVIIWYHGDVLYNGYSNCEAMFQDKILNTAWLEVALFGVALATFAKPVFYAFNFKLRNKKSSLEALLSGQTPLRRLQPVIESVAIAMLVLWLCLFGVYVWGADGDFLGVLAPYIWEPQGGIGRGQLAASLLDSIFIVLLTLSLLCASMAGVCAVLLPNGLLRVATILLTLVSWAPFLINRTRNFMLVVVLPAVLAQAFLRWRNKRALQFVFLIVSFLAINLWFKFVIANRSNTSIAIAVKSADVRADNTDEEVRHLGFEMFQELCWVNSLMESGIYSPEWGMLYYANFVNPIPRALWPGKPTMGLDYAIARGQLETQEGGTTAGISTGLVGSGISNFGRLLGPIAAAFLMSIWCAFLARLDLTGNIDPARLLLCMLGLVLTFNFGRDITIQIAYPLLFGFVALWLWRKVCPLTQAQHADEKQISNRLSARQPATRLRRFPS